MKIRRLLVSNFRAFEGDRAFELSDRFAVVAGINGQGKTSLLDGLASILMQFLAELGVTTSYRYGRWKSSDINANQYSAQVSIAARCAGIPVNNYSVSLYRTDAWSGARAKTRTDHLAPAVARTILAAYGDPATPEDQAPIAVYYTTDRAGYRLPKSLPTDLPVVRQIAYRGALSNRMVDYRDLMARYVVWSRQPESRERRAFDRALGVFLPGFSEVEIGQDPLRLTIRKEEVRISLQQLSDGERAFLAVIGDLVRRLALANPDLDDPLQGHGIVLIDELELHLHPRWQREVVEKMRVTFPNIQFIATTHSPFVIQSLRPGELINLDPEEFGDYANQSVEDIAEHVMGVDVPQKSERYIEMMEAAESYYRLLQQPNVGPDVIAAAEIELNRLSVRFSDDAAYHAMLKLELEARKAEIAHAAG